ncbi:MAG TPA: AAA family ATPase [Puia sp.]|jgi:succinoglycan biosynthesis transport protein ExoP|nr:AAA family ATPase [Puia sp.]
MDFLYLLRLLLKRKWWILTVAVAAAAIAWVLTMNQPKKYRSIAQISTGFTVNEEIRMSNENVDIFAADTKFNNVIVTFMSPAVISLLSYSLILHDMESPTPFHRLTTKQLQSIPKLDWQQTVGIFQNKLETMSVLSSFKPEEKNLLEFLALYGYDYKTLTEVLAVYRFQRTDYIQIDCTTENPELSAFIVNTVFPQFLRYYKNVRSSKTEESIDTLQSLMDKKKQDLDAKNGQLKKEGIIDVGEENTAKLEEIMSLETSLTSANAQQTQRTYELQKINQKLGNLPGAPITTAHKADNTNNELLILKGNMNEAYNAYVKGGSSDPALLRKYNNLKTAYTNKFDSLQSAISSTGATGAGIEGESKASLLDKKGDLEVDIRAGTDNINRLQNQIGGLKGSLILDASKGAVIQSLLKDAEQANKEYLAAKQKYNDAIDIATSSVNNFREILSGQPAIEPEPSKRMLIVGMAGASVFVITILIFILLTYLDSSIKTPVIFSKMVNLRLISMINFMDLKRRDLAEIIIARGDTIVDAEDNKRHNRFREALRKLRFEIENSGKKTFLFASTKKGEGKTTLIQALSFAMSMSKKKILIIDTNFCNNDLTVQLNADPILEKIFPDQTNTATLVEQVKAAAKNIGGGTVFAIGSEGGDYTPSEILPRNNLLHHLSKLTVEYDYIFLEGPPLNDFSDSKELVQYVDGVIAIFSAKHIIKQIDRQSMTFFHELNGKFCGAVLNMVDLEDVNAI